MPPLERVKTSVRSVLQDGKLPEGVIPSAAFPGVWNVPYLRNLFFTGREDLLQQLATALKAGHATAISQPQAISGLGGIGKTQLAVEYAHQHRDDYQFVLWTLADSRESLVSGYIAIAKRLDLPQKDTSEQQVIIEAVKNWLQTHGSWLLILDNADDLAMVRAFVPSVFGGHLLLTTRAQSMGGLAKRIEVETMSQDVGALFLLRRAGLLAEDTSLDAVLSADVATAREICEELGGLPLALDQAGAFVEEVQCSLQDYREYYRTRRSSLLQRRGGLIADHPEPVATTWSLSFEKVEQRSPLAADLLRLCAFLHPDAIPVELITKGAASLGPSLAGVSEDDLALDEAIAVLGAYSLIRRSVQERTLSIHRLVQAVLKDTMDDEMGQLWTERVVLAVNAAFPNVDPHEPGTWPPASRLLPQALTAAQIIEQYQMKSSEAGRLLCETASYLHDYARSREAEPLYQHALRIFEQQVEPEHLQIISALYGLADVYREQEKEAEAEPLYWDALRMIEQQLGRTHTKMIYPLHGLAHIHTSRGEYEQAEAYYHRALRICEQQLGEMHPHGASLLKGLASLSRRKGEYEQAEAYYHRARRIWEQQKGELHPQTAYVLKGLANLYSEQGEYTQAEGFYLRALHIREQILGSHNSLTAEVIHALAQLREAQGNREEARSWYTRALVIREQALGRHHPKTTETRTRLIALLHTMDLHEDAAQLEISQSEQ